MLYEFSKEVGITKELSPGEFEELKKLATEPDEKNTMTLDEFNKSTDKWRSSKWKDKQFIAELDSRYKAMETGKDKGFTVEQIKTSIAKLRKKRV